MKIQKKTNHQPVTIEDLDENEQELMQEEDHKDQEDQQDTPPSLPCGQVNFKENTQSQQTPPAESSQEEEEKNINQTLIEHTNLLQKLTQKIKELEEEVKRMKQVQENMDLPPSGKTPGQLPTYASKAANNPTLNPAFRG